MVEWCEQCDEADARKEEAQEEKRQAQLALALTRSAAEAAELDGGMESGYDNDEAHLQVRRALRV